ncbi:Pentatricopeptide repeat-containing protein, chloroplastic [Symbiodinium microadriaticum]|uniref:Pentatricopeptide repeat-containing protein, chloroplastic n=2 Tax=Symbiodinium TaxID=2949 RepID=A0A1Q9DC27_SYMMI|nr:Pentatricopeptide repeat-containing protein, chloroplastic [Symbiodinium microadriaticum]
MRIGVTRNLYCNPDALRDVEPPFNGQLLPANFTLVERKYLLIQFTKLVDVYAELTLRNFVSSLTCFGLSRLFNLAERAAPGQVRETLNATDGRLVAKAQQHFVIGSATQDMRATRPVTVLSRWKVETLIPSQLPNWVIGFLAVLDDIEAGRGQWQEALEVLTAIPARRSQLNEISFNAAISACEKGQHWLAALTLFRSAARWVRRDVITYNSSLSTFSEKSRSLWELAIMQLSAIRFAGLEPDRISFNATATAMASCTSWAFSLLALQELREGGEAEALDAVSYNCGITASEKGQEWPVALQLLANLNAGGLRGTVVTAGAAISACAAHGAWEEVVSAPDAKAAIEPSRHSWRSIAHNAAMCACERFQDIWQALLLFVGMVFASLRPSIISSFTASYNTTMTACVSGEQWQRAMSLFVETPAAARTAVTYGAAVSAMETARQWQEALALLVECRGRKLRLDLVIFNSVISACEKGGHWQGALQLLEDLEEASLEKSLVSYNAAISASEKAGYWQLALGLVAELRRRRLQENLITCCAAIAACTRGMEWSAALSLLSLQQRMKQEHHVAYVSAVNACVQSWQHQSAQRVLSELEMFLCGLAKTSARLGRRQIGNEWPFLWPLIPSPSTNSQWVVFPLAWRGCGGDRAGVMGDDDAENWYRFTAAISKKPQASLGLDVTYRSWSKDGVFVANVFEGGLVAAWNEKQEMPNRICVGDFIFQVNHVSSNPVAMIEELKEKTHLDICLKRRKGAEPALPPHQAPRPASNQETADATEGSQGAERPPRTPLEDILDQLESLEDEALAGLICIALERRPFLIPRVLPADGQEPAER